MEETRNVGEELKGGGIAWNRRRARNETILCFLLDVFYYFAISYFRIFLQINMVTT